MILLWILAVLVGLFGISKMVAGQVLLGGLLVVLAFLIGPGGVSIFS